MEWVNPWLATALFSQMGVIAAQAVVIFKNRVKPMDEIKESVDGLAENFNQFQLNHRDLDWQIKGAYDILKRHDADIDRLKGEVRAANLMASSKVSGDANG